MAEAGIGPGQEGFGPVTGLAERAGKASQILGALVSFGLVVGLGVWGWQLLVRDVSGIPVVRAMEGPMRVAPGAPGGEVVENLGLAVNAVPAEGETAPPPESLVLAPPTPGLAPEDLEVQSMAEAGEMMAADRATDLGLPEEVAPVDGVQALADAVASAAPPSPAPVSPAPVVAMPEIAAPVADATAFIGPMPEAAAPPEVEPEAVPAPQIIPADIPGVAIALRPPVRPARDPAAPSGAVEAALADALAVSTEDPPPGTNLVQLGAFPSADLAVAAWDDLATRFADFMPGRARLIQEAQSGGQTFYRLRATGFETLADARRFCAVLVAENAGCIPVVVR